jgi:hypothetical protein
MAWRPLLREGALLEFVGTLAASSIRGPLARLRELSGIAWLPGGLEH